MAESLRFWEAGSSASSKPGAKARPKGVVDAHTVEIPWLPKFKSRDTFKGFSEVLVTLVRK